MAAEIVDDLVKFFHHSEVIKWLRTNTSEGFVCFTYPVFLHQPARSFILEDYANEEESSRKHLKSERDAPAKSALGAKNLVDGDTIVDEIRETNAGAVRFMLKMYGRKWGCG